MTFLKPNAGAIWSRFRLPVAHAFVGFVAFQLLRLALALVFKPTADTPWTDYLRAFAVGIHFDLVVALALATPLAIWCFLVSETRWRSNGHRYSLLALSTLGWAFFSFFLIAEGFFFDEFLSRYNTVAIDYLIYPHEVFSNIREAYPVTPIILLCAIMGGGITWATSHWATRSAHRGDHLDYSGEPRQPRQALLWLLVVILLGLTVRISEARFSRERMINELANNSVVSVLTAAITRNLDYAAFFPTIPMAEAYARTRQLVATPDSVFTRGSNSLQRQIPGSTNAPKLNLVMLLEESLGSEFWGSLGRTQETLMPRMDRIATEEGWLFDHIYADGNRTIRGYEGILAGFPPLPGDSIVARDRSVGLESIGQVLLRLGYDTTFIYAGRGIFDGTGPFTSRNGWSNFIELKDFSKPVFTTVWGVSNEDLYDRVLLECRERHRQGLPFLMTSMSVSNHKPFTYPTGRIAEDPLARKREHAVKYSDFALGRFFDMARKEPFWTNTIFAVIADHGARVYGSQTIPIRSYEIPMVLMGPAIVQSPKRISTLGCQLDIAPTLLGLIGHPYESLFFGRDLLKHPQMPGRCLINHNRSIGIYSDKRLVVLSLNKQIEYFVGNPKREQMRRTTEPDARFKELEMDAVAMFQVADDLYMNRRYQKE